MNNIHSNLKIGVSKRVATPLSYVYNGNTTLMIS